MNVVVGLVAALGMALLLLPIPERSPRRSISSRSAVILLGSGALAMLIAHLLVGIAVVSVIAGVATLLTPHQVAALRAARSARRQAEAWPDLLDNLVSALRAGIALPHALVALEESAPPLMLATISPLVEAIRQQTPVRQALETWQVACADPIVDRVAIALSLSVSIGGRSLPTVLANLSSFLRAESRTRAELVARQSWTVHAARLAVVAPWLMVLILGARAREAYQTPIGATILIVGALASGVGYLWMTSVARLPQSARIFT